MSNISKPRSLFEPPRRLRLGMTCAALVLAVAPMAWAVDTTGTDANEVIFGTDRADDLLGGGGGDLLFGKAGRDVLNGGAGDSNNMFGGPGSDVMNAGDGYNVFFSDDGDRDTITGGGGLDLVFAADGGPDVIDCGSNGSFVFADEQDELSAHCQLAEVGQFGTNRADEFVVGPVEGFRVFGKGGRDVITGTGGTVHPGPGRDIVMTGDQSDAIFDDDGDRDHIETGLGNDLIVSADHETIGDYIDCGADFDSAVVDASDIVRDCEAVTMINGLNPWFR